MMSNPSRVVVDAQRIEVSILMLKQYLGEEDIAPLIEVLESIAVAPRNEELLDRLSTVFGGLGLQQGAVLTYAPYLSIVLAGDQFGDTD